MIRLIPEEIRAQIGKAGLWRWLDAGEVTQPGDFWDFGSKDLMPATPTWRLADVGYCVMPDEEHDVIRRVHGKRIEGER